MLVVADIIAVKEARNLNNIVSTVDLEDSHTYYDTIGVWLIHRIHSSNIFRKTSIVAIFLAIQRRS